MSKIQDVPFITKVIDTLSDELKSGLYDLIDGQVKTPVFRSLVNNDYAITEANDKGKVQFVTLETLRGNYTGYLAYNSVYCVLIAFKGNTQALDMLNINVAKHTFSFVNEALTILELRVELEDGKKGVTPTDLGVTNNNIHLAKGTKQIGDGINLKTLDGNTLIGSGNVGFKTINDQEIVGDGNIVVGEGGTIAIDTAFDETSTNAVQNKVISKEVKNLNYELAVLREAVFEVVLSEIDYTSVFTDSFVIPDTLTDTDGTHRVVFSETELKKVAGNSVVANQKFNLPTSPINITQFGLTLVTDKTTNSISVSGISSYTSEDNNFYINQRGSIVRVTEGHKYFAYSTSDIFNIYLYRQVGAVQVTKKGYFATANSSGNCNNTIIPYDTSLIASGTQINEIFYTYVVDLTQEFGAGNEPTTTDDVRIQWLIKYLENNPDYDAGTIKSSIINGLQSLDSNDEVIGTITIPPTEIKSAGTAQDYIEVVEGDIVEGEQLYNLVKATNIGSVDLSTITFTQVSSDDEFWWQTTSIYNMKYVSVNTEIGNALSEKYGLRQSSGFSTPFTNMCAVDNGNFKVKTDGLRNGTQPVGTLYYELATPTQTTIATNLHFSEIYMLIAEGGKIKPLYDNVPVDTTLTFVVKKAISE